MRKFWEEKKGAKGIELKMIRFACFLLGFVSLLYSFFVIATNCTWTVSGSILLSPRNPSALQLHKQQPHVQFWSSHVLSNPFSPQVTSFLFHHETCLCDDLQLFCLRSSQIFISSSVSSLFSSAPYLKVSIQISPFNPRIRFIYTKRLLWSWFNKTGDWFTLVEIQLIRSQLDQRKLDNGAEEKEIHRKTKGNEIEKWVRVGFIYLK